MGRPTDPNFWQQSPPPQTGDMNNERTLNQRFMRELPGALPPQDVIIHDGAISGFESAALIVDTEGEAAADELNVINIVLSANENLHPGMIITLRAKDQARTVTVKNSAAANGINTADGHDVVLSTEWDFVLRLVAGRWYEIQTRGDVRASDAQTDASTALARTAPATTTSRGIGRVATLADMEPGAIIENGPAFLAAGSEAVTTTPTAHAVPQADADGTLNNWFGGVYDYIDNAVSMPEITGSCTTNGTTDNTLALTGIVSALALEVGDVIKITGSTGGLNDKLFTVESITDANSIIVNYEHAGNRADGSLKLADETATVTITRVAKWYNAPLGLGQAWANLTSLRQYSTTYSYLQTRGMQVGWSLGTNAGDGWLVGGVAVRAQDSGNNDNDFVSPVVPAGANYTSSTKTGNGFKRWVELR